jgi:hypothetical protein
VKRSDPAAVGSLCFFSDDFNVDVADEALQPRPDPAADAHGASQGIGASAAGVESEPPEAKEEDAVDDADAGALAVDADDEVAGEGDAGAEEVRMANNPKGEHELKGFKALGFALRFNGNDVEEGIRRYEAGTLDGSKVAAYGLKLSRFDLWRGQTKVAGKKLLMYRDDALQQIFKDASITKYPDIWEANGALEQQARRAGSIARQNAVSAFAKSLEMRKRQAARGGGADAGHQAMIDAIEGCIQRIKSM